MDEPDGLYSSQFPDSGGSSTILRKRSIAQSHPAEIPFRNVPASSIRRVSSAYRTSRPRFSCVTSPAPSSTRRCFTIAWRVTFAPSDSVVADCAPRSPSLFTTESRVRSPSAKNTSAITVLGAFDISLYVFYLRRPAGVIHKESPLQTMGGHALKPRFDDR